MKSLCGKRCQCLAGMRFLNGPIRVYGIGNENVGIRRERLHPDKRVHQMRQEIVLCSRLQACQHIGR